MPLPPAPEHMWRWRGQTMQNFGYDTETQTQYSFNSLGYRSELEFDDQAAVIILGNTISFGLGVDIDQTYAEIIAHHLDCAVYNFAWGCYAHTNAEQLILLKHILSDLRPRHVIFQINNLNRLRINGNICMNNHNDLVISEFEKFTQELDSVLEAVPHTLLHWDEQNHTVNLPKCLIHNKYHVDSSLKSDATTFGPKSHKLIAHSILQGKI